ncbi:hypothetical protein GALMADRAFT_225030 [Galerina marginata CBS 339.88]|uniref:Uncharacterized protein n=1 Tax=Galerina marginata (strain CBS 339.88) TaxID=685588 RepID=A0A067T653_GALM3|nr:hypothetical protein GALMADRAFT_225030 [Galerina marginata CBS 339.88]
MALCMLKPPNYRIAAQFACIFHLRTTVFVTLANANVDVFSPNGTIRTSGSRSILSSSIHASATESAPTAAALGTLMTMVCRPLHARRGAFGKTQSPASPSLNVNQVTASPTPSLTPQISDERLPRNPKPSWFFILRVEPRRPRSASCGTNSAYSTVFFPSHLSRWCQLTVEHRQSRPQTCHVRSTRPHRHPQILTFVLHTRRKGGGFSRQIGMEDISKWSSCRTLFYEWKEISNL